VTTSVEGGSLIGPPSPWLTLASWPSQRIIHASNVLPKCMSDVTLSIVGVVPLATQGPAPCLMAGCWMAPHSLLSVLSSIFGHKLQSRDLKTRSGPKYEIRQYASFPFPLRPLASRGRKSVRLSPRLSPSQASRAKITFPLIHHSQDFDFCSDTIMYRRLILILVVASPRIP